MLYQLQQAAATCIKHHTNIPKAREAQYKYALSVMLSNFKAPTPFLVFRGFPQTLQAMHVRHIKFDQGRFL